MLKNTVIKYEKTNNTIEDYKLINNIHEIDRLSQSSFLSKLELVRNSTEGIQIDHSADTIILDSDNEIEIITRQNKEIQQSSVIDNNSY